jgi:uncharacterized protein YdeI (YjbR/CyaY-like superfamily)
VAGQAQREGPELAVESVEQLRAWLAQNSAQRDGLWLLLHTKATGGPRVEWGAIVDELLCVGWIDSLSGKQPDGRQRLWISPRRPGSGWSGVNKDKVARLRAAGRMGPAGEAVIAAAEADGSWTVLDGASALQVPDDLQAAFACHPGAEAGFAAFPPSARRALLEWLALARRPETRARRVEAAAEGAARGVRANAPAAKG